jgi:hypothetical protein
MQKLYIMKNSLGLLKIGISSNPERRANSIRLNSGFPTEVIFSLDTNFSRQLEKNLHTLFSEYRVEGEWFKGVSSTLIIASIPNVLGGGKNLEQVCLWYNDYEKCKVRRLEHHKAIRLSDTKFYPTYDEADEVLTQWCWDIAHASLGDGL